MRRGRPAPFARRPRCWPSAGGKTSNGGSAAIDTGNDLLVENSTITGNEGYGYSAIRALNATLVNSTVSGNTSTIGVPAVSTSKLTLVNSTVAYTSTQGVGVSGTLVLRNSIIANNGTWDSCEGATNGTYEGTNIVADTTCGGQGKILIAEDGLRSTAASGCTKGKAPDSSGAFSSLRWPAADPDYA
jgi:hypothetical protein